MTSPMIEENDTENPKREYRLIHYHLITTDQA